MGRGEDSDFVPYARHPGIGPWTYREDEAEEAEEAELEDEWKAGRRMIGHRTRWRLRAVSMRFLFRYRGLRLIKPEIDQLKHIGDTFRSSSLVTELTM